MQEEMLNSTFSVTNILLTSVMQNWIYIKTPNWEPLLQLEYMLMKQLGVSTMNIIIALLLCVTTSYAGWIHCYIINKYSISV